MSNAPLRAVTCLHHLSSSALVLVLLVVTSSVAIAADIEVTAISDSGDNTLREAVETAVTGDVIVFNITTPAPVITLASPLPAIGEDVSFRNDQVDDVVIERNGNPTWEFSGGVIDPTGLNFVSGGAMSADADVSATPDTTLFGDGTFSGNLTTEGTISPGASENAGSIGTLEVTGALDATNSAFNFDLNPDGTSDLVTAGGALTLTDATFAPNFVDGSYSIGQSFTLIDAGSIVGAFTNAATVFELTDQPFLEVVQDLALPANQFGLLVQDNGVSFESVAEGANQTSASIILDELLALGTVAAVNDLREGSIDDVDLAVAQLSGSIYPTLIAAEINHIQTNLTSIREQVGIHPLQCQGRLQKIFWARGYGVSSNAAAVESETDGYGHTIGGAELGGGLRSCSGWGAYAFAHWADSSLRMRGVEQDADISSYRAGALLEFRNDRFFVLAAGGSGNQEYSVRRPLDAFTGSTFAASEFDGSSKFGCFEFGPVFQSPSFAWGPYAGAYFSRVDLDAIVETGDPTFALQTGPTRGESYRTVLGLSFSQSANTSMGLATSRVQFGWMHEFSDTVQVASSQIAAGTLTPLISRGVSSGNDWGYVQAQMNAGRFLGAQVTGAYVGQYNGQIAINSGMLGLHWSF